MCKKLNKVQRKIDELETTHDANCEMVYALNEENEDIEQKLTKLYKKENKLYKQE